mmetsp:Transcript_83395/g.231444  ORF Transcript_83395/g.231444 Transcript_83395/m.231444 type:complete len:308 (-) Transcript_83395:150-1073(-)
MTPCVAAALVAAAAAIALGAAPPAKGDDELALLQVHREVRAPPGMVRPGEVRPTRPPPRTRGPTGPRPAPRSPRPSMTRTPRPSASTAPAVQQSEKCTDPSCSVYADPHVSTFDAHGRGEPEYLALLAMGGCTHRPVDVNAYETGDFWIMKARDLHIQGRFVRSQEFVPDRAAVGAVAVGGCLLKGQRLLLEPLSGRVAWAGKALDPVVLEQARTGGLLELSSRPGPTPNSSRIDAALPQGVRLTAVRFERHLDLKLTVPAVLGAWDGLCGNGNGLEEDDTEDEVRARMGSLSVAPDELLFKDGSTA